MKARRTFSGPIIDTMVETGMVHTDCSVEHLAYYCLAVDAGTGELVLLAPKYEEQYTVSVHNPLVYVKGQRFIDREFIVTP